MLKNNTIHQLPDCKTTTLAERPPQEGVVLIMALIMLVIISMVAAMSARNATSSEGVNANLRQSQLANQAAETALRYCEGAVLDLLSGSTALPDFTSPPSSTTVAFSAAYVKTYVAGTPSSVVPANWDSTTASNLILVLPANTVNHSGITSTFSRSPECMVAHLAPSTAPNYSKSFSVTARGFGPEVPAADSTRSRPIGSEVWMQSTLEIN